MGGTCCVAREKDHKGKSLLWLPWYVTDRMIHCVNIAEEILGRPPTGIEIFAVIEELGYNDTMMPVNDAYATAGLMFSMLREHMVMTDEVGYRFTTKKHKGYFTYTEIFDKKFPGYMCGEHQEVVAGEKTKSANFSDFW